MRKHAVIHIIIFIAIVVIVLPLVFSLQTQSVNGSQYIRMNSETLVFYLRDGQTVTGSLDYDSEPNTHGAWYLIIDPDGNGATERTTENVIFGGEGEHGTFSFTAKMAGEWSIYISTGNAPYQGNLIYSYTISTSYIFGINPIVLICLVVAAGAIAELVYYWRNKRSPSSTLAKRDTQGSNGKS